MSAIKRLGLAAPAVDAGRLSENQRQTEGAFGFKWHQLDSFDTEHSNDIMRRWLLEKYCDGDESKIDGWLAPHGKIIVDAGCGAALSASLLFGRRLNAHSYLGIDISNAVEVARQRFQKLGIAGEFLRADLLNAGLPDAAVDVMFSEGVLHHTDDTAAAIRTLARSLKPGGLFIFYIYRKKGPVREFTDDYVRERLRGMSDPEAWNAMMPLTKLGQALGRLNVQVDVPEDIPLLQIEKGKIDVQRLFYWHVMKVYYREEMSLDEMNHINFDWFRPLNCHRHTVEELRAFCAAAGLRIDRLHEQESGFSVIATRTVA